MFIKKCCTQIVCASVILLSLTLTSFGFSQEGLWGTKSPMPTPRVLGSANEVNGIIYVIGGTDDPSLSSLIGLPTVEAYDPVTDSWTKKVDMPTPRQGLTACSLNGKIYAIGGQRKNYSDYLNIMEEYDPLTDTWTTKTPMPGERDLLNAGAVGNKIYVIGGMGTQPVKMTPLASVIAYDPVTDTWEEKAPMSIAKCAMGIVVYNDKIYAFGGAEGWGPLVSIVEEYDSATDTWTTKNDIPTKRWFLSSCIVNGKIYTLGGAITGWDTFTPTDTVEVYDPATDLWDSGKSMPIARMGQASCVVNGKIYVFGGSSESGPNFNIVSTVHEFTPPEPETSPWASKTPMPEPRLMAASAQVGGIIYVIGGITSDSQPKAVSSVLAYDPRTDTWTSKADMPTARHSMATCCLDGKIYAVGGSTDPTTPGGKVATVEVYDPIIDTWQIKSDLPFINVYMAACTVNGKIYAIGGMDAHQRALSTVLEYDPTSDTWSEKTIMPTARNYHAASMVDGKIYTLGGAVGVSADELDVVEEYDPASDAWTTKQVLPIARLGLTACEFNRKIYAIGGSDGIFDRPGMSTVEEYDPATNKWEPRDGMPTPRVWHTSCAVAGKIYTFGGTTDGYFTGMVATTEVYTLSTTNVERNSMDKMTPEIFTLTPNFPNPFNPTTTIEYSLAQPGRVRVSIYNLFGQHIRTLVDEEQNTGVHTHVWNATDEGGDRVSSGIYLYRIEFINNTGKEAWRAERKMVLLK